MTPQQLNAMKLALEALEGFYEYGYDRQECFEHITAIKEALLEHAMQEVQRLGQEIESDEIASILACRDMLDAQPVPPQRKPLTEEDCRTGFREQDAKWTFRNMTAWQVWRTACEWNEAAHGIKENT
jgi:hypothetical protein